MQNGWTSIPAGLRMVIKRHSDDLRAGRSGRFFGRWYMVMKYLRFGDVSGLTAETQLTCILLQHELF